jgi:hypothetical protein
MTGITAKIVRKSGQCYRTQRQDGPKKEEDSDEDDLEKKFVKRAHELLGGVGIPLRKTQRKPCNYNPV